MVKSLVLAGIVFCVFLMKFAAGQPGVACTSSGSLIPNPGSDCAEYLVCVWGQYSSALPCPAGTLFNILSKTCDFEDNVNSTICETVQAFGANCDAVSDLEMPLSIPGECTRYYYCYGAYYWESNDLGLGQHAAREFTCPGDLLFNLDKRHCDFPANVDVSTCTTAS